MLVILSALLPLQLVSALLLSPDLIPTFLQKSTGGCPAKLFSANIFHSIHLISTQKAETAIQVTKSLSNIINQPLHPSATGYYLKKLE
jgi:hypothetical protein